VRTVKIRRRATVGELSLCLDEVEHVGTFLEVGRLVPTDGSGIAAQEALDEFVRSLAAPVERIIDTYDSLARAAKPLSALT
jgi:adenylate cyclase class 2